MLCLYGIYGISLVSCRSQNAKIITEKWDNHCATRRVPTPLCVQTNTFLRLFNSTHIFLSKLRSDFGVCVFRSVRPTYLCVQNEKSNRKCVDLWLYYILFCFCSISLASYISLAFISIIIITNGCRRRINLAVTSVSVTKHGDHHIASNMFSL